MPPAEAAARFIRQSMKVWPVVMAGDRCVRLLGEKANPDTGHSSSVAAPRKPVPRMVVVCFGRTCVPSSQPLDRA